MGGVLSVSTTVNNAGWHVLAAPGSLVQVNAGGLLNGGAVLAGSDIVQTSGGTIANATLTARAAGLSRPATATATSAATSFPAVPGINIVGNKMLTITNGSQTTAPSW